MSPRAVAPVLVGLLLVVLAASSAAGPALAGRAATPPTAGPSGPTDPLAAAERSLASAQGPAAGGPMLCGAGTTGATCRSTAEPATANGSSWWVPGPGSETPADWAAATGLLADDPAIAGVVFLDADSASTSFSGPTTTWLYAQGAWTNLSVSIAPVACGVGGSGMAYDAAASEVVLVEGTNCTENSTTWTFAHDVWTELSSGVHPSGGYAGELPIAYDPGDDELYVATNGTWAFANGSWASVGPNPAAGSSASLAYDSTAGTLVLTAETNNETWEWGTGGWSAATTSAEPLDTFFQTAVDDPAVGGVLFFGVTQTGTVAWAFAGGIWTEESLPAGIGTLGNVGVVAPSATTLLLVGVDSPPYRTVVTWQESGGTWTNATIASPSSLTAASLAYDAADSEAVLFGGYDNSCSDDGFCNATWTFANGSWTELAPARAPTPRENAGLTYDASDGYVVLFGGYGPACATSGCTDTWEFVGGTWSEITPPTSPPGSSGIVGFTYDPLEGYSVLYDAPGITWAFQGGNWTNLSASTGAAPPGAPASNLAYDPAVGAVVLVGTYGTGGASVDPTTWGFANGSWSPFAGPSPPARGNSAIAYEPSLKAVLLFGGYNFSSGREQDDTWELANGSWTEAFGPGGPPAQSDAAAVDDVGAGTVVLVGSSWWTWGTASANGSTFSTTVSAAPNPAEVGAPLTLTAQVTGGIAPFTYTYGGLPAGCASQNASSVACTPTVSGTFPVTVTVVDGVGNGSEGQLSLAVLPELTVHLVAVPSTVAVGARTLLETNASAGESPYFYAYTQLPDGCATESIPTLPCTPSEAGSADVDVAVTDAVGVTVRATANVTVVAGGAPGAPSIAEFNASPLALVLGNTTILTVVATAGGLPLSYTFAGLPPGCSSANVSQLDCTPNTAGAYPITVDVQAPSGRFSVANLSLNVLPAGGGGRPYVLSFAASPPEIQVGEGTTFVVATNASAPLSFAYLALPTGCTSANVARLFCGPRATGNFSVEVVVTAPLGNRTVVATTLDVVPAVVLPPSPAPPPSNLLGWELAGLAGGVAAALGLAWAGDRASRRRRRSEGELWVQELLNRGRPPEGPLP